MFYQVQLNLVSLPWRRRPRPILAILSQCRRQQCPTVGLTLQRFVSILAAPIDLLLTCLVDGLGKRPHSPEDRATQPPNKKLKKSQKAKKPIEGGSRDTGSRDRWKDFRSPIMPAAIDSWMNVLAEEKLKLDPDDREEPTFPGVSKQQALYAAPDGFILGAIKNSVTQAGSLLNYARLRPLIHYWLESVNDPKTSVRTLRSQAWRTLLGLEILGAGRTTGRAADNRADVVKFLKDAMTEHSEVAIMAQFLTLHSTRCTDLV